MMQPNRYSKLWRRRLKDIAEQTLEQDDSNPLDLIAELEVQRVVLAVMIDRLNDGDGVNPDDMRSSAGRAVADEMTRQLALTSGRSIRHVNTNDTVVGGGDAYFSSDFNSMVGGHTEFLTSDVENVPSESEKVGDSRQNGGENEENQSKVEWVMENAELIGQIRQQLNDIVTTVTRIVAQRNQTAITKAEIGWLLLTMREGMDRFVPKENQQAYIKWMMDNLPGGKRMIGVEDEDEDE